ncbi:MAG: 16S rRNA (cytosine(1402)-N(4))-methyltransferase RsmH [Cyclobacteriaceae bacterium]
MTAYHVPVMLQECIEALQIKPDGVYVDLTFGGGGHSAEILKQVEQGHLYAFDQDDEAGQNAQEFEKRSFTFIKANFRFLEKFLRLNGVEEVDGILADLGISSHQIDEASRGFSTRGDGELDMRMNQNSQKSAAEVVNGYDERELRNLFFKYGELKNAGKVARALCASRINKRIATTTDLIQILEGLAPRGKEFKFYAQVFQAIRIEVNDEMTALEGMLEQCPQVLKKGGRVAMMSYHSLEDRLVKNFFNKGNVEGKEEKDFYGNVIRPLAPVNRKPIIASEEEIKNNNRARSAKLRVAEKN